MLSKLLKINILIVLTTLLTLVVVYSKPIIVSFQLPPGITKKIVYVPPNQTVIGYVILESNTTKPEICRVHLVSSNCTLVYSSKVVNSVSKILELPLRHVSKIVIFRVVTSNSTCILDLDVSCIDYEYHSTKIIESHNVSRVDVILVAPSDSLCKFNAKLEKYTYVITSGNINPILKIASGFTGPVHPHFIGFMCIKIIGSGYYTVVILIQTSSGKPAPISSVSPENSMFGVKTGIITLEGVRGNSRELVQLWTYVDPSHIVGKYRVVVYVYPYGSNKPILKKVYTIRIMCLERFALILVLFSTLIAIPFFIIFLVKFLKRVELKELVTCALISCLIFITAIIPSYIVWGIASILGPFDWVIWGFIYDVLRMMYYGIAISIRPKPGTFSIIMFVTWILSVLYFGRLSILSILWTATSAMFYELFLLITRSYSDYGIRIYRCIIGFIPATLVDNYVDLMLYMTLYRLFYADWYVSMYVIGVTLYSIMGFILGLRLSNYLRSVMHE